MMFINNPFLQKIQFVLVVIFAILLANFYSGCKPVYISANDPKLSATTEDYYSYTGSYVASLSADAHTLTITISKCLRDHQVQCIVLLNSSLNAPRILSFDVPLVCADSDPDLPPRIAGSIDSSFTTGCTVTAKVVTSTICRDADTGEHILAVMPFAVGVCL